MNKYTFTINEVQGEHGHQYPLLTANEYPWMNVQIVPTPEKDYEHIMDALKKRGGKIAKVEGRNDFCAIQAGGGHPDHPTIEITAQNYKEVADALKDCLQAAAEFWAAEHIIIN